ncbi:MAG: hypothetical protein ACPGID_12845 [Rubricella sp.]
MQQLQMLFQQQFEERMRLSVSSIMAKTLVNPSSSEDFHHIHAILNRIKHGFPRPAPYIFSRTRDRGGT